MTAQTKDRFAFQLVSPDVVLPPELPYPVEANTSLFAGALVGINAAGFAVPASSGSASAAALRIVGVCKSQVINTVAAGFGAQGALTVVVSRAATGFNNSANGPDLITQAMAGLLCYAADDDVVCATDGGGLRPCAGAILTIDPVSLEVMVQPGMPSLFAVNTTLGGGATAQAPYKARAVITALPGGYTAAAGVLTATVNGAITSGDADGVTVAAGDVVLLEEGATNIAAASDGGPYVVTNPGSAGAGYVLTRPAGWWENGETMVLGQGIDLGGEGTIFGGTKWVSYAAKGSVIGTTAPSLFPKQVSVPVTLAAGFVTVTSVPIRTTGLPAHEGSGFAFVSTDAGNASTVSYRTGVYATGGAATAAGHLGTASVSITALVAAGTIENADVSTGILTIFN